jgi:hydroxymethylpyrimidine pyrophosphatase-like HAD family hydrolase
VLFTEWLETSEQNVSAQPRRPSLEGLAQYVAARVGKLQLTRDPVLEICLEYGGTGWTALILTLRNAYGPLVGRLKSPAIRQRLARYIAPSPTMVDGQMKPEDWLLTTGGYRKVDFEHHNFGRTELYIVDPAYDLACASFEFGLSEREEEELVTWYVQASEDSSVLDRLLLWKLLYGTVVLTQARAVMQKETRSEVVERWHRRSFGARNFLVYQMNLFCGGLLPDLVGTGWTRRLVFLDLDGVFDTEFFGFPQTTTSGLLALALLQAHGYSVLLNTARSIKDVRQYCKAYRLPGGVAETGCVFYDAIQDREVSLVDPESAEQLDRCREALRSFPGVFIDPNYRLAIRVFVPSGDRTVGLPSQHVSGLLEHLKLDRLTFIPTSVDTTILPRGIGKASGLSWAREYLHASGEPIVAFGDSDQDIEMLLLADRAFAPSNCSKALRELSASHRIKRVRSSTQRGLLEAALLVVHPDGSACIQCRVKLTPPKGCGELIRDLMRAHELSRIRRYVSILDWRGI